MYLDLCTKTRHTHTQIYIRKNLLKNKHDMVLYGRVHICST